MTQIATRGWVMRVDFPQKGRFAKRERRLQENLVVLLWHTTIWREEHWRTCEG